MRTLFVTDPLAGLQAEIDATVGLMTATQDLGVGVWACQPEELAVVDGRVLAWVRRLRARPSQRRGDRRSASARVLHAVAMLRTPTLASHGPARDAGAFGTYLTGVALGVTAIAAL